VGIPRWAIAPDLPDIYNIWLLGIAIDIYEFATSFSTNNSDVALEFRNEFIKLAGLYIDFNE
jgi:hypothetical protein